MHPRFFDMVRYAAARSLRVSTNTNLTLLTQARAQQAVSCGLAEISVSVDAASSPLYESIRLDARLPRVLRNLDRLMRARDAAAAPPSIRIVMVLMRRNLDEVVPMVELAARHRVSESRAFLWLPSSAECRSRTTALSAAPTPAPETR